MVCLSQNVASFDFRCLKVFGFLATNLVISGGGKCKGGSKSKAMGMWICSEVVAWVIAGATGLSDRRGLRTVAVGPIKYSEEYLYFSELLEVCIVDPICIHFEFIYETGGAEVKFLLTKETGDESRTTSVSEKKWLVTGFIGSLQCTVS